MAKFTDVPVEGNTDAVHDTQKNALGMSAKDELSRLWVYLKGVANCLEGSWVTYDELAVTTLLAANAIGPVAVAGGPVVAGKFGWFCVFAPMGVKAQVAAACADNARVGREGADGVVGDGRVAGDEIYNAITRASTTTAAAVAVQILYPYVDDVNGA